MRLAGRSVCQHTPTCKQILHHALCCDFVALVQLAAMHCMLHVHDRNSGDEFKHQRQNSFRVMYTQLQLKQRL